MPQAGRAFSMAHREAERLLEPKPEGCYLVRFSESAVTFVLTYRWEQGQLRQRPAAGRWAGCS